MSVLKDILTYLEIEVALIIAGFLGSFARSVKDSNKKTIAQQLLIFAAAGVTANYTAALMPMVVPVLLSMFNVSIDLNNIASLLQGAYIGSGFVVGYYEFNFLDILISKFKNKIDKPQ